MFHKTLLAAACFAALATPAAAQSRLPWDAITTVQKRFERIFWRMDPVCQRLLRENPLTQRQSQLIEDNIMLVTEETALYEANKFCVEFQNGLHASR